MKKIITIVLLLICTIGTKRICSQTTIVAATINNTCFANGENGLTADVKFNSCIASLPSTGGIVDGTGLRGPQTIAAKVDGSTKPISFLIGAATFTVSSSVGFDLGTSGTIVGLAPGPSPNDTFTTPVSAIKAGVNNTVLVRSSGVGGGQVIRNLTLDGNKSLFSGATALQLVGSVDTQIENIAVKNCDGEAVQLIAPIELHWTNGLVENNGTSASIHASASGLGSGSGNLSIKNVTVRLNGGDGILIEGGGAGIKLDTMNIDRNGGAGIRLQMQSVINATPTGLTLDTVTLESNADPVGQLVVSGSTATIVSLNVLNPTCNGSNQLGTVAPTCFVLDNVVFATFIGGSSFSGVNSFKVTNSSNVLIVNFKNGNTNLYASGSAVAETINTSPRVIYSAFYSGTLSATGTFARIIPDKAITVTRVNINFFSSGSTCTVFPKIRVSDGTRNIDITASTSQFADSGAMSQNYAAGANVDISLNIAQSCTAGNFQNANVEVQYTMQ